MAYPVLALQQALFSVLNSDATLQNLVNGVYDHAPADAAYPFVSIDNTNASDWSFVGGRGVNVRFELQVYSRYSGKVECHRILERLDALLYDAELTVPELNVVQVRSESGRVKKLSDTETVQGALEVIILAYTVEA